MTTALHVPERRLVRFGHLSITYDDSVLAPRAWTESQSRWAAEIARTAPDGRVLELCAGAGQIGLLAIADSDRALVAVDRSASACRFIEHNAESSGLAGRVEVRHSALETACAAGEVFPIIIADPPWVPHEQIGRFPEDPLTAIDGGPDGLDVAGACLAVIDRHLHLQGAALLQVGDVEQVAALRGNLPPGLRFRAVREEAGRGVVVLVTR